MINTILAEKGKMNQAFIGGRRIAVTKAKAGPCVVTQIKKMDKDGYWAVQLGFGERKIKNTTKALQGHLKGAIKENRAPRFLQEVRFESEPDLKMGDIVNVSDVLKAGDIVTLIGVSKGKGFAGGVKRWHFKGGPRTHGQSDRERAPGSIGATTTPGRIHKGKHMAGRMGAEQVTVKNLQIVSIDPENDEVEIAGSIPGVPGGVFVMKKVSEGALKGWEETKPQAVVEGEAPAEATEGATEAASQPEEKKEETQSA
jgi:large subunit ribosomal protein L3